MKPSAAEYGTFWVWEAEGGLPPPINARVEANFEEITPADLSSLAGVMNAGALENAHRRFEGPRRCFSLQVDGEVISYGWVTHGPESTGELERKLNLGSDESYVWDCATLPDWRRKGCYSTLLSRIILQLHGEGVPRAWIGASRLNQPSIQGIARAGFKRVLDLDYRRLWFLVFLSFRVAPQASPRLAARAKEILLKKNEIRIGQYAVGLNT